MVVSNTSQPPSPSDAFSKPPVAASPSQLMLGVPLNQSHHSYHLTLVPGLAIAVIVLAVLILVVLLFLIQRKRRELEVSEDIDGASSKVFPPPHSIKKIQEGTASPPCLVLYILLVHLPLSTCGYILPQFNLVKLTTKIRLCSA